MDAKQAQVFINVLGSMGQLSAAEVPMRPLKRPVSAIGRKVADDLKKVKLDGAASAVGGELATADTSDQEKRLQALEAERERLAARLRKRLEDIRARDEKAAYDAKLKAAREEKYKQAVADSLSEIAKRRHAKRQAKLHSVVVAAPVKVQERIPDGEAVVPMQSEAKWEACIPDPKKCKGIFRGHPLYNKFVDWLDGRKASKKLTKQFCAEFLEKVA